MNKRVFNVLRKIAGEDGVAPIPRDFLRNYRRSPMDIPTPSPRTQMIPRDFWRNYRPTPQHAPVRMEMPGPVPSGADDVVPTSASTPSIDNGPAGRFSNIFTQRYPVSTYQQLLNEYRDMGQRMFSGARDTGAEIASGYRDSAQRALRGATEKAARIAAENENTFRQHVQDNYSADAVRERAAEAVGLDSDATAEEVGGAAVRKGFDWLNRRFGR